MLNEINRNPSRILGYNILVQHVFNGDIAFSAFNCLKMNEFISQAYELGGPHIYN